MRLMDVVTTYVYKTPDTIINMKVPEGIKVPNEDDLKEVTIWFKRIWNNVV